MISEVKGPFVATIQDANNTEPVVENVTLEWIKTQEKPVVLLQHEMQSLQYVKELNRNIDYLSDTYITGPSTVADAWWEKYYIEEGKYIVSEEGERWTYPFDPALVFPADSKDYYNASNLVLAGQKYVAAQSPLATTFRDFWKMMIHTGSTTIIALNMAEEDADEPLPRPVEYWKADCVENIRAFDDWKGFEKSDPRKGEKVITVDDWTITYQGHEVGARDEKLEDCAIVKRTFIATNALSGEKRDIVQFHYQNWPDFKKAPSTDLFLELLRLVEAKHKDSNEPITVHCAAGMGRAGAFVATHSLRRDAKLPSSPVNFVQRVFDMRTCRKDMVSEKDFTQIASLIGR